MTALDDSRFVCVISEKCRKCGSIAPRGDAPAIKVACTWLIGRRHFAAAALADLAGTETGLTVNRRNRFWRRR